MAKKIFASPEQIDSAMERLKADILKTKSFGKVNINIDLGTDDRTSTLCFTPTAWLKMKALVEGFSKEVEWHGLCTRLSENVFEVEDIITFPHKISDATVTSDEKEYQEWLNNLPDETFNKLHFHGHSHVNMGVTPSSVDMDYRHNLVSQLPRKNADSWYVFMILNKPGVWSAEIYDLTNNAMYDTKDISIFVDVGDGTSLQSFVNETKKIAVEETPVYNGYNGTGGYYGSAGGYSAGYKTGELTGKTEKEVKKGTTKKHSAPWEDCDGDCWICPDKKSCYYGGY